MSPAEIAWRLRSLLRDQSDIVRVPLGLIPRLPDRTQSTVSEFEPGFSCSPVTHDNWSDSDSQVPRDWLNQLVRKADNLLENRLSYFDLNSVDHGDPFDWHRDHSADVDSPVRLSVLTDYRDFATYGDCKLVWEPNRHHQLVVLARAWIATRNEEYAEKVAQLLRSWIDANPFGYGMNWKSPLELGVRVINWVWAIDLLRDSNAFDEGLWRDIQKTMYMAMWDGQRKFSRGSSANNHLIGEAAGVFIGACYFQDFPRVDDWARKSQAVLEREIELQTYGDGCTREHAFGYQFFVIQFFTLCMLAGDVAGRPFSGDYRKRLHSMYRFLHELAADTGLPPNMGDADSGYVLDLGELPDNAAALLAVGACVFDDPDLSPKTPSETVYWITGELAQDLAAPTIRSSLSFADCGYHLLRGSRMRVFFDCAELGYGSIAAHGHADCLSLCLSVDGQPLIVDAGTYDYFTYPDWRKYFRETRAHNTAEVDGRSQSEILGPFMFRRRASARLVNWHDDDEVTEVVGEHDGYMSLPDPVVHRRRLSLDKTRSTLLITDSFTSNGNHMVRIHFHLHPECQVQQISESCVYISCGEIVLALSADCGALHCISATGNTKLGWISDGYHQRKPSTCIRLEQDLNGTTSIEVKLVLR
jgi:hypothetical protein